MSAWIVSKQHIDAMVTAGLPAPGKSPVVRWSDPDQAEVCKELSKENADGVGRMLWQENRQSVNYRYGEDNPVDPIYGYEPERHSPLTVLKLIECYEYQSCEHPGWENGEARKFCQALRVKAVQDLPGYDAEPWGI
jgi:hypothetical protein